MHLYIIHTRRPGCRAFIAILVGKSDVQPAELEYGQPPKKIAD